MTQSDTKALKALVAIGRALQKQIDDGDGAYPEDYHDVFGKLEAALPALERLLASPDANRQAWLPIETAPKDGSWVLGYYPVTPLKVWPMCWCEGTGEFETPSSLWAKTGKLQYEPTHWMPLPQPPHANSERTSVATESEPAAKVFVSEDAIMVAAREAEADILRCFYVRHIIDGKPWHNKPPTIEDGELRWHIERAIRKHLGDK